MPKLKLEQLKPGMIVAVAVKNLDDMLLAPAGCELSERHISILETWGITEIEVETGAEAPAPVDPLSKLSPQQLARLQKEVQELFWEIDPANAPQQEIVKLMLRRKAKNETLHR
jgi:hypothetical protein